MSDIAVPRPSREAWVGEVRSTLALSWPLILTNVAQTGMTATDVLMLGRLGPEAVAASALGANLYFFFLIFGIGIMSATAPLVATERGRNPYAVREVRRIFRQGVWAAGCICIPCWLVLWNGETVLLWLGQEPRLAAAAGSYLHMLQWSMLPFMLYLVMRSFMAALERPTWAMLAVFIGLGFNAFANWLLIFGNWGFPALGLRGSGLATLSATILMVAVLVGVLSLDRRFRRYHVFGRLWRPDWSRFRAFWRMGLPIGATLIFEVSIFNAAVMLMGVIGPTALAAHAVAIQIASLTFMIPLGLAQAATVRVGRAYGSGDREGATIAGWTAMALGVGFMVCTALLMVTAPRLLIGAFLDVSLPSNAAVIETATVFLAFAALFQVADGAQVVGAGMLRGLHDTRVPMVYAAIGYWGLGLPLGAVMAFPLGFGGAGIWCGLAGGLGVVALLMLQRWMARDRLGLTATLR